MTLRDPQRILIVRLSHLGDVVHALGVFHALHAAYPTAEIAWAIQPEFSGLLRGLEGLGRVLEFDRRGGLAAWWRLRRELVAFRADLAVDAQGNAKSAGVSWLSGAPRRVAPARSDWQEPWAAWTAGEQAAPLLPGARHAMQRMAALVRHLVPGEPAALRLDPGLLPAEIARGEELLERRLARLEAPPLLLHLSTPGDVRGWPESRWHELIAGAAERGRPVLVLSGPAETGLGRRLEEALPDGPRRSHWVGQRGLRELAAFLAAGARRGLSLVACDSGPLHLAAAVGLRVIALEGPQDPARTGPWPLEGQGPHAVATSPRAPACAPCLKSRCAHPEGPVCMRDIQADAVLALLG